MSYTLDCLRKDPKLQLVDLGANIGTYTLAVARAGRRVLAVEASAETLRRLSASIRLGNASEHVTLLHNAVSEGHERIKLGVDMTNRGDAFLLAANNCSGVSYSALLNHATIHF